MEKRQKHVRKEELGKWEGVTQELMSDEDDDDGFKGQNAGLEEYSEYLNDLIKKLDERRDEEERNLEGKKPLQNRRKSTESPMKRQPSKKVFVNENRR